MTHNTREVDDRQIRSDWQEFWYKESKNTEQSYLTPDTHGIVIDYLKELYKSHHQELQKARHNWLQEEIVKLEEEILDAELHYGKRGFEQTQYYCYALRGVRDRYQGELDQPTV